MEPTTIGTQPKRSSAGDFFLHLGIFVALYITAVSLLSLLFTVINKLYPDALNSYYSYNSDADAIRWTVSSIVIMFPIYLILGWIFGKQLKADPDKKTISVRKGLIYLTLFIAGLTMAIDLIYLVYTLLGGEITERFVLKVLAVLIVAGLIFGYYLTDVRSTVQAHGKILRIYSIIAIIVVIACIITGYVVVGSPVSQRKIRFDQQRVSDLQNIQWRIINYWQKKGQLPESLASTNDSIANYKVPSDPESHVAYTYTATGTNTFKLCATFSASTQANGNDAMIVPDYYGGQQDSWTHAKGSVCFDRTIDPQYYPVQPQTIQTPVPVVPVKAR